MVCVKRRIGQDVMNWFNYKKSIWVIYIQLQSNMLNFNYLKYILNITHYFVPVDTILIGSFPREIKVSVSIC